MSHDLEGAINEVKNKAAEAGGNAVRIYSKNQNPFTSGATAEVLKCNLGKTEVPIQVTKIPETRKLNSDEIPSFDQSVESIAHYFAEQRGKFAGKKNAIVEIVNIHSKEPDRTAKQIRTGLQASLDQTLSQIKIVDLSESDAGVSLGSIVMFKGTYQQSGNVMILRVQAVDGKSGDILVQGETQYKTGSNADSDLTAIMPIESSTITPVQKSIISNLLSNSFANTGYFKLVSTAEIDKMNPEAIEQSYKCTRDECAIVIGEQLGVDNVISVQYDRLSENVYYLTGKVLNVKKASVVATAKSRHNGDMSSIENSIDELARKLSMRAK